MRRVKFDIDENDEEMGVKTISFVDKPAIESEFVVYSKSGRGMKVKRPPANNKKKRELKLRLLKSMSR